MIEWDFSLIFSRICVFLKIRKIFLGVEVIFLKCVGSTFIRGYFINLF